jgi:hypothetical protein
MATIPLVAAGEFSVFFVAGLEFTGKFPIPCVIVRWRTAIFGVETPLENPS